MKTDDLIIQLTEDEARAPRLPFWPGVVGLAVIATAAVFSVTLGPRHDLATVILTPRFATKVLIVLCLASIAVAGLPALTRPTETARFRPLLALPPLLLALAVAGEMIIVPTNQWGRQALGSNALVCLAFIPTLSLAALALILTALRRGAPSRPVASGALAGLAAGAIGACFYAFHCTDDSPLFVSIWYPMALGVVTALGAYGGHRFLRW